MKLAVFYIHVILGVTTLPVLAQSSWTEFEPGVISNGNIYKGVFTPDNRYFYFFRKVSDNGEDYRIFVSTKQGQGWSSPEVVQIGSGAHSDMYPAIAADGKTFFFTSYRLVKSAQPAAQANIWTATMVDYKHWSEPMLLKEVSSLEHYESNLAVVGDRDVVFRRVSPDWSVKETYIARWQGNRYATPALYDPVMRWKNWNENVRLEGGHPSLNETIVLLTVRVKDNQSGQWLPSDQWYVKKYDNKWTEPKPLTGTINTTGKHENFAFLDATSERIFVIRDLANLYSTTLAVAID